jgi:ABC-type ATPase involved in cell division
MWTTGYLFMQFFKNNQDLNLSDFAETNMCFILGNSGSVWETLIKIVDQVLKL